MAEITADIVKKLRDATTVSMMECKRALVETNGDIEKATKLLRERGMAVSAKRADKAANQGIIAASTTADGLTGAGGSTDAAGLTGAGAFAVAGA